MTVLPMRHLLWVSIIVGLGSSSSYGFVRGDANADGGIDIGDAVTILTVLFTPGSNPLECPDRGDTNDDGAMDISDAVYLLSALFVPGSPTPPAPYPDEGDDPTPDSLTPDCPPVGPVGPGAFFTIARGDDSNAPAGDYMIYDNIGWGSFWAMHASGSPPTVDFSVDIVVAVVRAFPNFEHCLDITSLEDDFVNTIIEVEHQRENLPCALYILPTTPYHIVRWENAQSATPSPLAVETLIDVCPLVCP